MWSGNQLQVLKLAWVGTRTENAAATAEFFERVLGLRPSLVDENNDQRISKDEIMTSRIPTARCSRACIAPWN